MEIVCRLKAYRRFESSSLRQRKAPLLRVRFSLVLRRDCELSALSEVRAREQTRKGLTLPLCSFATDALIACNQYALLCAFIIIPYSLQRKAPLLRVLFSLALRRD